MNFSNQFLTLALVLFLSMPAFAQQPSATTRSVPVSDSVMSRSMQQRITPAEALQQLVEGNRRFAGGHSISYDYPEAVHQTAAGQYPFAVILSCVDSRTSSEIIFDQNLGAVFNARIAGNFVNTDILGSMEFACKVAGAKLILVVGHTKCGAVKGACDHVEMGNLTSVMNEIKPAVESVRDIPGERNSSNEKFVEAVAKQNVLLAIQEIREKSPLLKEMEDKGQIMIAGGMYDLKTGIVDFNLR
ncbi:MAG: carbonic anhydrase [Chitinophagales bacterium]|nr:carbonic anhydrase [Chitinophagales bacterium]